MSEAFLTELLEEYVHIDGDAVAEAQSTDVPKSELVAQLLRRKQEVAPRCTALSPL